MARKFLPNGRNTGEPFSRVTNAMQESKAFQSLSAPALRVLLRCPFKNFNAATSGSKGVTGRPTFKLTNAEAREHLGMSADKFSRAKDELERKGFIEWAVRGGMKGCNGVASQFVLSSRWKEWSPDGEDLNRQANRKAQAAANLKHSVKRNEAPPTPWQES